MSSLLLLLLSHWCVCDLVYVRCVLLTVDSFDIFMVQNLNFVCFKFLLRSRKNFKHIRKFQKRMIAAQSSMATVSPTTPVIKMATSRSSASGSSSKSDDRWIKIELLAPGAAQAVSSIAIGHPFDTVKTRVQTGMLKKNSRNFRVNREMRDKFCVYNLQKSRF